jgi:LytR cell envelope-related transcriptional attenuator/cell envelope-related transcriptional attenuator-like protein
MSDQNSGTPTRTARSRQVQRRWLIQTIVAVVLVALLIGVALAASNGGEPGASPTASTTTPPSVAEGPSQLLALAVTGAPNALLATIGTGGGRETAAVVLPPDMTVVMPGAGEMTSEQLRDLDGPSMQIGVSNVDGAWNDHYAIMDLDRLGALVDRMGGLNADLGDIYPVGDQVLGPGETLLSGEQVIALLRERADDTAARWADVLNALLAGQPLLSPTDLSDTDDQQAAAEILGSGAARIEIMPTQTLVGASTTIPAQPDLDDLMTELFDTKAPARAEVRNGNGEPGVGSSVGALLIPAGFRVVLSDNADTFDHQTTQVIADGPENEQAAVDAKQALGVGKLIVSQVPSGVADVTVIVGHDFHA